MSRGHDKNLLFSPSLLSKVRKKAVEGILLPEEGRKIFFSGDNYLLLGAEENVFQVDFSSHSLETATTLTHTERASSCNETLVAFHKNGTGYEQSFDLTLGIYDKGNRWVLNVPFASKNKKGDDISFQALDGQLLLYQEEEERVYSYAIPEKSEMAYTESLLSPRLWHEHSLGVEHFLPGDGGALLFFRGETDPLYIAADGKEYTFPFSNMENLGKPEDGTRITHAPHIKEGMIYLSAGKSFKIVDFNKGSVSHVASLREAPREMSSDDGHVALLFSDRIMIYKNKELLVEEKMHRVSDIHLRDNKLTLIINDRIIQRNINEMIKESISP
jgi:hypothetical protein